jgi:hypothetical protein
MASSLADIPEQRLHPEARTLIRNCTVNCDQIKQLDCIPAGRAEMDEYHINPRKTLVKISEK